MTGPNPGRMTDPFVPFQRCPPELFPGVVPGDPRYEYFAHQEYDVSQLSSGLITVRQFIPVTGQGMSFFRIVTLPAGFYCTGGGIGISANDDNHTDGYRILASHPMIWTSDQQPVEGCHSWYARFKRDTAYPETFFTVYAIGLRPAR